MNRQDSDKELDVIVNQPVEEKISLGSGNISLFKMMQEGMIDLESESSKKKQQ